METPVASSEESKLVEVPKELSKDILLGQVVEALNNLIKSNKKDHDKIFARLDEGDQYFALFKVSRCLFSWLDEQGVIKYGLYLLGFFVIDWVSRSLYWDLFPKP